MEGVGGGVRIQLNVYDVLPDLAKANKVLADYIGAGGAFHSGVVIHYRDSEPKEWVRQAARLVMQELARARVRARTHTTYTHMPTGLWRLRRGGLHWRLLYRAE